MAKEVCACLITECFIFFFDEVIPIFSAFTGVIVSSLLRIANTLISSINIRIKKVTIEARIVTPVILKPPRYLFVIVPRM